MIFDYFSTMRKSLILLTLLLLAVLVQAQPPQGISYQAVARNAQGQVLSNTPIKVRFSILDSTAVGPVLYTETQEPVTSAAGLFSVFIGSGNSVQGTLTGIAWGVNAKFLKVELDPSGTGSNYVDLGTQQMMSVPYSLYSGESKKLSGSGNGSDPNTLIYTTDGF